MDEITAIAEEYGLFVVEDCAQSFGASWKGQKTGAIGVCGAFSFFPSKNLGCFGDGGMVSTNDDEAAAIIRMLLKHGGKDKYNVDHIGYNARLDTLQAAILLAKLRYVDDLNTHRRNTATSYNHGLKNTAGIILPFAYPSSCTASDHVFHQFTVRVPDGRRDVLQSHLRESGIDSMVYYPVSLNSMKVFNGRCMVYGELRGAEQATREVLSLPIEPLMTSEETTRIVEAIKEFCTRSGDA
jgi:dTDP-4-amino-4,6-dideoxygalactose transaminase